MVLLSKMHPPPYKYQACTHLFIPVVGGMSKQANVPSPARKRAQQVRNFIDALHPPPIPALMAPSPVHTASCALQEDNDDETWCLLLRAALQLTTNPSAFAESLLPPPSPLTPSHTSGQSGAGPFMRQSASPDVSREESPMEVTTLEEYYSEEDPEISVCAWGRWDGLVSGGWFQQPPAYHCMCWGFSKLNQLADG